LHRSQSFRTSRCATTILRAWARRNGSTPILNRRDTAPAASFVWERGKGQVPRIGELHGDVGGDPVADFPHHDDVGIVTEYRPYGVLEIKLVAELDLPGSFQQILDRILDGDRVDGWVHHRAQRGHEAWCSCRFPSVRSGSPCRAAC